MTELKKCKTCGSDPVLFTVNGQCMSFDLEEQEKAAKNGMKLNRIKEETNAA